MDRIKVATYTRAAIPGSEIQEAVDTAMAEILRDPASRAELLRYGLDEETLRGIRFSVEQAPGIQPTDVETLIFIAAAGQLTAESVKAVWGMVFRRVRNRKGDDALEEEH